MAISAGTVWEIRSTGTAGNVNGGGFNPNNSASNTVDYSQQDDAEYTFSDLASTNANTTSPQVTSASHTFVTTDVGNILRINSGSGWTPSWYEIKSVSGGAATLDRACGTVATPSGGGTYHVGGALTTMLNAWSSSFAGQACYVWIKGSISLTATFSPGNVGTIVEGYDTVRGDAPMDDVRPLINMNTFTFNGWHQGNVKHLRITGTSTSNVYAAGQNSYSYNIKVINSTTTGNPVAISLATNAGCTLVNCEAISYRGNALNGGSGSVIIGCYLHDSVNGVNGGTSITVVENIIDSCVNGITLSNPGGLIHSNTLYGSESPSGNGISISSTNNLIISSNIIYGFETGINNTGPSSLNGFNNVFSNNTTAFVNYQGQNDQTSLSPAFVNVHQVAGSTATTSGNVLTQTGADFSNVTDNRDFCYIVSGTGVTAGQYLITGHTTDTLTLDIAPGTNATEDKVFKVTTGRNFAVGPAMVGKGFPNRFPAGLSQGFPNCGAVMRLDISSYTRGRVVNEGP